MDGVEAWQVHHASPADVVPGTVMLDVHGVEVPRLPVEELGDVDGLEEHRHHHRTGDKPNHFVLLGCIANQPQLPKHHSISTVGELLHIESQNRRVQFGSPEEIHNDVSIGAMVLGRGEVQSFECQEENKTNS